MIADPGGCAYPLTPHAVTTIRAVDLMAHVRGRPVVLWPVFVTPDGDAWVTESGKGKARRKRDAYYLKMTYLLTEENVQRRQRWDALEKEITALKDQQETILKAMKLFTPGKVAE